MLTFQAVLLGLTALLGTASARPKLASPVPVVIWHGLGDRFDAPGLLALKADLESRAELKGVFVHIISLAGDGASDQRVSFFGNANTQVALACEQLLAIPELVDPELNPSGKFDAIGLSQGGVLLRGLVERCGGAGELQVRNLITAGSPHMGVNALPPCPPGSSPFSTCRLMHLSIIREGMYSGWAQHNVVPAQYFREEARIDDYLEINEFLRDINNERPGDEEVGPVPEEVMDFLPRSSRQQEDEPAPRNTSYKENFAALEKLVLIRFDKETTLVPPQTAHFTLPTPDANNCPTLPDPVDPTCYLDPVPYSMLPLYAADYVGLRQLDEKGALELAECDGAHMEISDDCWETIVSWLGEGKGKKDKKKKSGKGQLVFQGL